MNTIEFLREVLPAEGTYFAGWLNGKDFRQKACPSTEDLARTVAEADSHGSDAYFACASFRDSSSRTRENALGAKAFWMDLDCGEGKDFSGKTEAKNRLIKFCKAVGLPVPMIVVSGYGLHVYWRLTRSVPRDEWVPVAKALKELTVKHNFPADPSRTADISSILRPAGSHNYKKDTPKEVKVVYMPEPMDFDDFRQKVSPGLGEAPKFLQGGGETIQVAASYPEFDYDANQIAEGCAVIRRFKQTQGDLNYPAWQLAIGLLTKCKDGRKYAAQWSSKRAETGHTNLDWQTRFDTWSASPPTCEKFRSACPELCKDCPHKGNTPLTMGRIIEPEKPVPKTAENAATGLPSEKEVHLPSYVWNENYRAMVQVVKIEGQQEAIPFSPSRFYLTARIQEADHSYSYKVSHYTKVNGKREFLLPVKAIGAGGALLLQELAAHEILTTPNQGAQKAMVSYLKEASSELQRSVKVTRSFTHYGWYDNKKSFLLGEVLHSSDGSNTNVLLRGNADSKKDVFPAKPGRLKLYFNAINEVYARRGMEPMQYAIASLWAAPLAALCKEPLYKGIPCALTGVKSGKGKTTAFMAGLAAYGIPGKMSIMGKEGATPNARTAFLSTMCNLPILIDEITNIKAYELSELAYVISNGGDRSRLSSKGVAGGVGFVETGTWCTQIGLTGNSNLIDRLSVNGNADAESMRIFEIRVDDYNIPTLDIDFMQKMQQQIHANCGAAGSLFIDCVLRNKEAVTRLIQKEHDKFVASEQESDPKFRFYRWHAACTMAAVKIFVKLGLCRFNTEALYQFARKNIEELCGKSMDTELSATEIIYQFIEDNADLILSTDRWNVVDLGSFQPKKYIARLVKALPSDSKDAGTEDRVEEATTPTLRVIQAKLVNWCNAKRYDFKRVRAELIGLKAMKINSAGVLLTRGIKSTKVPPIKARCIDIFLERLLTEEIEK